MKDVIKMDFSVFTWIAIFALSAMIVNTIGIWFVYKNGEWAESYKEYFICFAAGVLIASPLIMAFPEAISKNSSAGLSALAGFLFMFVSNKLIHHKTEQVDLAFGITAIIGIGIHSFIDGVIYSVTFSSSITMGLVAGLGLVLHEFSEGVITFTALINGGVKHKKAAFYAFIVAALTTPIGAFVAYPFVKNLDNSILGLTLGAVSGVLIYLSASHLLPEAERNEREHSYFAFALGVGLALLIMYIETI